MRYLPRSHRPSLIARGLPRISSTLMGFNNIVVGVYEPSVQPMMRGLESYAVYYVNHYVRAPVEQNDILANAHTNVAARQRRQACVEFPW